MAETYRIETIKDMLQVPADRREAMFRELEFSLALCELTRGDRASLESFTWIDDGKIEIRIDSPGGDDGVMIRVVKDSQAAGTREGTTSKMDDHPEGQP